MATKIKSLVRIDDAGHVVSLFDDDLRGLYAKLGKSVSSSRASHVDLDEDAKWWADLGPVGGPKFGPFEDREKAIEVEKGWLRSNGLPWPGKDDGNVDR